MTPYYQDHLVTLHHGDCLDVLATMPDHSVDAVVTDPPYGLGFMGKTWDSTFTPGDSPMRRHAALDAVNAGASRQGGRQRASEDYAKRQARDARSYSEWCERWASECLRVLKPGGHLLAFGGTRTAHRLASGIEDAGFEIRDTIAWLYGSGFPKSLDVSKALDKHAGHWRGQAGAIDSDNGSMSGANYERTDKGEPVTAAAAGWGTALKPANEPIIVARRSPIGTVADNWIEHGTGALNIDACRTATSDSLSGGAATHGSASHMDGWDRPWKNDPAAVAAHAARVAANVIRAEDLGRWPTNVILDENAAADLDQQTSVTRSRIGAPRCGPNGMGWGMTATGAEYDDEGGASRFFPTFRYEAKAPTTERPAVDGIVHPTVKPLDLMRWLVRLVTPPGGTVLEPFAGSGTTAEACVIEGFRCIAVEREADYLPLIVARLTKPIQPDMFGAAS